MIIYWASAQLLSYGSKMQKVEPLRPDALRVTEEGRAALILRTVLPSLSITVLVLERGTLRFEILRELSLHHPLTVPSFDSREVLKIFRDLTLEQGHLFQPEQEIAERPGLKPRQCPFDHSDLSLEKGAPGCTRCGQFVCNCGRCLCGYQGVDTFEEMVTYAPLPVSREDRVEYIRALRFCVAAIEQRPKAKVLLFTPDRKKQKSINV
jgi:hypothetical protein